MYTKGCASIACLMGLLVPASAAWTDTFEVSLDGLLGHYTTDTSAGSPEKKCAYDFGTAFLEVQEVRIRIAGTFYGGLWVSDLPYFGPLPGDVTAPGFFSVLYPEAVGPGVSVVALDCSGAFDVESVYDHISIPDWERVKQGWGEVSLSINVPLFIPEDPHHLVEHATGDVTQATLIFEGTPVPAPAVMALLGTGALAVARRRKPAVPGRSR